MTNDHDTFSPDIPELKALLAEQLKLYEQLRAMGREQSNLVQQGQAELLLTVLARRQHIIDQLGQVTTRLQPYRDRWQTIWASLSSQDRQAIGPMVRQAEQQLAAILEQDARDRDQIIAAKQQVGRQLAAAANQGAAMQAYGAAGANRAARYTNQQG